MICIRSNMAFEERFVSTTPDVWKRDWNPNEQRYIMDWKYLLMLTGGPKSIP